LCVCCFFLSSRRRHTMFSRDWSSDVCSSDLSNSVIRTAWLHAGLPPAAGGLTIDCQCGSAQQAVHVVAALIAPDVIEVGMACGRSEERRVGQETRLPWTCWHEQQ